MTSSSKPGSQAAHRVDFLRRFVKGKTFLVTGGSGSIGSEIVRQLLAAGAKTVRVFSNDEDGQFNLQQSLQGRKNVRYLLGDIRDRLRLRKAIEGADAVFHAAALKHVPACELNPFEAVMTNVVGTRNVIEVALEEDVQQVVAVSTDKATSPVNVLGATKLLAERLTTSAEYHKGSRRTTFSCVRFGNVLASRGSVFGIFSSQIRAGGPVTVTDPGMTRFVMSIHDSVTLVLKAAATAVGGETFILKMPSLRVGDLAEVMVRTFAPRYGRKPSGIRIRRVGMRRGEKYHEELMNETEARCGFENGEMFILVSAELDRQYRRATNAESRYQSFRRAGIRSYSSGDQKPLSQREIQHILESDGPPY